jgi:transcriptional regulator with XRE-family HTH domain
MMISHLKSNDLASGCSEVKQEKKTCQGIQEKILEENWNRRFAERLDAVRQRLGMTKGQFSQAMDSSQRSMTGYLQGTTEPKPSCLAALSKRYLVSIQWLLTGEGEMFLSEGSHSQCWAERIKEDVQSYTRGLSPLSQILSAIEHTVAQHVREEKLSSFKAMILTKNEEPEADATHEQAAKELYELKATMQHSKRFDTQDIVTLYTHVLCKHYSTSSGSARSAPKEQS